MDGSVAPILWYLFWVALAGAMVTGVLVGGHKAHIQRMTALNILKTYAEKGTEPPEAMTDLLMGTAKDVQAEASMREATHRASQPTGWLSFLFMAGAASGLAWWRIEAGGPDWAVYASVTCAVTLGVAAAGMLVASLVTAVVTALAARK